MQKKELKIVSLNTWGGRVNNILDFFETNKDLDIFCFQEIIEVKNEDLEDNDFTREDKEESKNQDLKFFTHIKNILRGHNSYFRPQYKNHFGLAIFINKDLEIEKETEIFVYKQRGFGEDLGNHARNLQCVTLNINDNKINILNFHGLWTGTGKNDTEDRIRQSENIVNFLKTLEGEIILSGDFNLNPDTESIKMIEDFGLKNLIRENNITSTRTSYYPKDRDSRFADYTFVSNSVDVKSFEIMKEEVSDHSAMKLIVNI